MIPLSLSILSSSVLLVIFRYFSWFRVNNLQAITVNYFVAAALGFMLSPVSYPIPELTDRPWSLSALIIGCVFIIMFYTMAISSQKVGVAVSSVANKMSLVIPVIAGIILYDESLKGLRLAGAIAAIMAVVMVIYPRKGMNLNRKYLWLPAIIFLGSGFLDTVFKYVETHLIRPSEIAIFSASLFLVAATAGLVAVIADRLFRGTTLEPKNIIAGSALGIPNYFSIHFLLQALNIPDLQSTMVFPINNTGIVLLSTLLAILLFAEKLSKLNWGGIGLALVAIFLITIG